MRQGLFFLFITATIFPCFAKTLIVDPNGIIEIPVVQTSITATAVSSASASTYYINSDGTGDYPTIQTAVDNSFDGDEIILSDGIYTGEGNRDINLLGKAITVRSENGPGNCIIDCKGTSDEPHRALICETSESYSTIIEGLTVINGYEKSGGAIFLESSSPVIRNCIFRDNTAALGGDISGAAIFSKLSKYNAINCLFYRNESEGDGGAVFNYMSNPTLINCTFTDNSGDDGDAMFNFRNSRVALVNCLVFEDSLTALVNQSGSHLTIRNCDIIGRAVNFSIGDSTITYLGTNISEDPLFEDISQDDHRLYYDSPCIDAGAIDPQLWAYDIQGNDRLIDGNNDGDIQPDIGAYEMDAPDFPVLFVSQNNFVFNCLEGDPDPQTQTFSIWNGSPESITWELQEIACDWLTIVPTSGVASSGEKKDVALTVNSEMLTKGSYQCEVDILSDIAVNTPKTIDVVANVLGPIIEASSSSITFIVPLVGDTPSPQELTITNTGGGILDWRIINTCDWLAISKDSGSNGIGQSTNITLSVNTAGLGQGVYDCSFEILDENADNSPLSISVRLLIQTEGDIYVPFDYPTIQEAVNHATDGQTVSVADGTYTGTGNYMINFYGKKIVLKSLGGYQNCTIECETHDDSSGFIFSNQETKNSIVDGFTIVNAGRSGIFCINNSSPTIRNCRLRNNTTPVVNPSGGGIYCRGSSPIIEDCTIENNYISKRSSDFAAGGGIYAELSSLIIDRSIIRNNVIYEKYSGNMFGGGVFATDSTVQIKNSLIVNNACELTGQDDPIYLLGGAGLCGMYSVIDIVNSTITDNFSDGTAGGIFSYSGVTSIKNSIVANNPTWDVYEICVEGSAYQYGYPSLMNITGSDIPLDVEIYVGEADRLNWQQGNIRTDPLFVDSLTGNYQLRIDSPCIDTGINWLMDASGKDISGGERLLDGNGDNVRTVDMGCYEFVPQIKAIEVDAKLTPQALNRKSKQPAVIGRLELTGVSIDDLDSDAGMILMPGDIEAYRVDISGSKKKGGAVSLKGFFDNGALMEAIAEDGEVQVTISAKLRTGHWVYGTDAVKVK